MGIDLIQVRLDRLFILVGWEGLTSSSLMGLPRIVLDHDPILFNWKEYSLRGPRNLRYEIMWQSHPNFSSRVAKWWGITIEGTTMYQLFVKLDNVMRKVVPYKN